jgi:hypothetical protein
MKRGKTFLMTTSLIAIFLLISPVTSAIISTSPTKTAKTMETVRITIGRETVEKEVPLETINAIIDLGKTCKEDFLTIYDKTTTAEQVQQAFSNIRPFFQALIDNKFTDKTIEELNDLYYNIREKIQEPMRRPKFSLKPQQGAQPLGIWNGMPTPIWANSICGIFDAGFCAGFAGGTHALIPTIGGDLFITYGFQGESLTVGLTGGTLAVSAFQVIIGFVGILIATPIVMIGPYFMTGLCGFVFGIGA